MKKISIALCTYNGAKFLEEQLESFSRQTRLPDELVVCDDRSGDETNTIIENFARRAPFPVLSLVNEANLGSTKNFEKAIALCRGDLIFLSDQDDVWFAEKIERMAATFDENSETALIFSNAELVDENLCSLKQTLWDLTFPAEMQKKALSGKMFEVLLWQNVVTGATTAFRAAFRAMLLPIPNHIPNLIHDGWIALVLANRAKIEFINESLIKYRQHSGQQLGVNLQFQSAPTFADRRKNFASSVDFVRDEQFRLARMKDVFDTSDLFENRRENNLIAYYIEEKQQIIEHYEARKNLSRSRARRFLPISAEILSGRYYRFSRGFLSAAKDLLQK